MRTPNRGPRVRGLLEAASPRSSKPRLALAEPMSVFPRKRRVNQLGEGVSRGHHADDSGQLG
jgi:hypothetical protein